MSTICLLIWFGLALFSSIQLHCCWSMHTKPAPNYSNILLRKHVCIVVNITLNRQRQIRFLWCDKNQILYLSVENQQKSHGSLQISNSQESMELNRTKNVCSHIVFNTCLNVQIPLEYQLNRLECQQYALKIRPF